jgi:di/tricarboxylate transporter
MPIQAWITLLLLLAMFAVLATDRLPTWLVLMATLAAMMTLRLAPEQALVKGFGNVGVLTVAALFPVAAGMYSTGAISLLSSRLIGQPKDGVSASLRLLPPVTIASAFLNNTPLVAMMIPVVRDLKRTTGLNAPTLFMGLSFASVLGGNMTLIGSAVNLIVAGMVVDAIGSGQLHSMNPVAIFDLAWVGVPAAVAGLSYLIFVAPHLLPSEKKVGSTSGSTSRKYLSEFRVQTNSNLDGKNLEQAGLVAPVGLQLLSIHRDGADVAPAPDQQLRGGDVLVFTASSEALPGLWSTIGLVPAYGSAMQTERHRHQLVEVVVSTNSAAVGRHISELPVPDSPYEMMLVGVSRDGQVPSQSLLDLRIQAGDAAVLEVNDSFFYENRREADFTVVKPIEGHLVKRVDRAITASLIAVAMVVLAASQAISMLNAALLATFAMLVTGCLTSEQAWRSIQWSTLVVLGAALGLESAVTASGLSETVARLCAVFGSAGPRSALGVVFVATILMTNIISNAATAAFMFPVALSMSQMLGVNFKPLAITIMVAASCAFINPAGFQTNLMVQKDGGYSFGDFVKVGLPLTVIVGVVVVMLGPIVYGF